MNESEKALRAIKALPVVKPEDAEDIPYVVCMRETMFASTGRSLEEPGIVRGNCVSCKLPVVSSANMPKKPARICLECAVASGIFKLDNAVRSPHQVFDE